MLFRSNEKDVESLFSIVTKEFGGVDVIVNNAGIIRDNVIWKMPVEDFDKVIDINKVNGYTPINSDILMGKILDIFI